jgi:predicted PurR-regulated permease PerM
MKTKQNKLFLSIIIVTILCLFIYLVRSILLPFIVAIIAAYFLNPAADKMQKLGLSRMLATIVITSSFFLVSLILTAMLAPVIYNQFITLLHTIPTYVTYVNEIIIPEFSKILEKIDPNALEKAKESIGDASGITLKFIGTIATNLLNSGIIALNLLSIILITPIVTFYMLNDWHKIVANVNSLIPVKYKKTVKTLALEIDRILAGYIRGQTQVCLIIGAFYAIGLTIAGLEFAIFIGLATGLLLFIPYVGMLVGFLVGMLVAFFQFADMGHLAIIAGIFLVGQILESVFITPNLVGNKVGLHPIWIMFGLLAGSAMFGFIGVLVAVPVTAVIGVLARFLTAKSID